MNHSPLQSVETIRKVALYIGCAALAIAAFMSATFGLSMSVPHAALLGLLTLSGSIIFPYAGHLKSSGSGRAAGYFFVGALFLAAELFSHCGYTIGQRTLETEDTGVQNAAYTVKQDSVKRNADTLASLKSELAALKQKNEWAASVSADGLRASIPALDEAIRQETARGGCGPRCLKLTNDKADVENRIAVVEKVDGLNSQITTVQALVNGKEAEATSAEFKSSPVVAQTAFVSQIWTMSLEPDKGSMTGTQIAIGFLLALVTTFLAPAMFSIAWGPIEYVPGAAKKIAAATEKATDGAAALLRDLQRQMEQVMQQVGNRASYPAPAPVQAPANHHAENYYVVKDDEEAKAIKAGARQWLSQHMAKEAA